jgi:hypothetical protein
MIVSVLGTSPRAVNLGQYLSDDKIELICTTKNQFDRSVKKFADENNIPSLIINLDNRPAKGEILCETRKTMIDSSDFVLILWDQHLNTVEHYIRYCKENEKYFIVEPIAKVKSA